MASDRLGSPRITPDDVMARLGTLLAGFSVGPLGRKRRLDEAGIGRAVRPVPGLSPAAQADLSSTGGEGIGKAPPDDLLMTS